MKRTVSVVFEKDISLRDKERLFAVHPQVVISPAGLQEEITARGSTWIDLDAYVGAGNIYEANALVQELSLLRQQDGSRITKSVTYGGYELWWIHYAGLFSALCLPYTQYAKLLDFLRTFDVVYVFEPPHQALFSTYFRAYERDYSILRRGDKVDLPSPLPFGVLIQILITLVSFPVLIFWQRSIMLFTGDRFAEGRDYDARMSFIYEEMRRRDLPFVEFVRSLEPWKVVLTHALTRRRPAVYSVAIWHIGSLLSLVTGARSRRRDMIEKIHAAAKGPEERFRLFLGTHYLLHADTDIWAIRITKWILHTIGVRAAYIAAAVDRNFHAVIGCKLERIPTVGILHGAAVCNYNVYDFLPTYDGTETLTVDQYGLWSDWWKIYYLKHGRAYTEEQLHLSGPMRPLVKRSTEERSTEEARNDRIKVLFISEQLSAPEEVLPYIEALLREKDVSLYMKFRPYRDGFETWLTEHHPEILVQIREERILRGDMQQAIAGSDVVIGSHSTAVLEAFLGHIPAVFFATKKWGDAFDLSGYSGGSFYANDTEELLVRIRESKNVPRGVLEDLRERYFGDPYRNGGRWVVDQLAEVLS